MIKVIIEVNDKKVGYRFEDDMVTLSEAALLNLKLDEAKDFVKSFEFESEFEIKEGYDEDED
jgi:hypothetical protein